MTDDHYASYREMLDKVDWDKYGVFDGEIRDARCENCMMHCGYEPTTSLGIDTRPGDMWKTIKYNFGPRPAPVADASHVDAFNGVSTGRGHLTGAKQASKPQPMMTATR
jgi:hypothetical protein